MIILPCRRIAIRAMVKAMVMVICAASTLNHEEGVNFLEAQVCGFGVVKAEDLDYPGCTFVRFVPVYLVKSWL